MNTTVSTPSICRAVAAGVKVLMSVKFPVHMLRPNIDASLRQQLASLDVHPRGGQRAPVCNPCQAVKVEAGEEDAAFDFGQLSSGIIQ